MLVERGLATSGQEAQPRVLRNMGSGMGNPPPSGSRLASFFSWPTMERGTGALELPGSNTPQDPEWYLGRKRLWWHRSRVPLSMRDGDSPASLYSPSNPLLFSDRWRCCWRPSIRSPRGLQCKAGTWPSSLSPSWRTTTWRKWCSIYSSFPSGMEPSRFYWAKGEVGKLQGLLRKPLLPFPLSGAWQQAEDLNLTIALVFAFTETAR